MCEVAARPLLVLLAQTGVGTALPSMLPASARLMASCCGSSMQRIASSSFQSVRLASSKAGELLALPSRKGLFNDAQAVSSLLPHRANFQAQFTPHGIQLVPKSILQGPPPKPVPQGAAFTTPASTQPPAARPMVPASQLQRRSAEQEAAAIMQELAAIRAHLREAGLKLSHLQEFVDMDEAEGMEGSEEEQYRGLGVPPRRKERQAVVEDGAQPAYMELADRTKEWRRLKIKKHKIKKRRKANRYKTH